MSFSNNLIRRLPEVPGLRVLMYHKLSPTKSDTLTVTAKDFYEQMLYLLDEGYFFLSLTELHEVLDGKKDLRPKSVLITFDDAYVNNRDIAAPILEKLSLKYVIYLPVGHLGQVNSWDEGGEQLLSFDELRKMKNRYVEYGLHSYHHRSFTDMSLEEVKADLELCKETLTRENIPFLPSLAYPYGAFPRQNRKDFFELLSASGIKSAFRIGNAVNLNLKSPFELKRIDIQGTDSNTLFKLKMKFGKTKF
ncbi:MAG: polysaccharide deacetylase family protein [Bacteriovoracaceae bacterium]